MKEEKITFENIQKANETIKPMPITRTDKQTGKKVTKKYAEVNQRIKAFRMIYPQGAIVTDLISNENGICIFKALVQNEEGLGLLEVHLYRPFSSKYFFDVMPKTVSKIAVLDRTKEPGSAGEPLYLDVCAMYQEKNIKPLMQKTVKELFVLKKQE